MKKPKFQHDCEKCQFMGHYLDHDMYYCDQSEFSPTVVVRYGSQGPEYQSGIFEHLTEEKPLGKALQLAKNFGYIS